MQVAENTVEGLKRVFTVTLPADEISKQEEARLAELGKDARLPGFRPGKAPMAMLKQRYGANVRGEVLEKSIVEANGTLFRPWPAPCAAAAGGNHHLRRRPRPDLHPDI